ncbi:non-classical arabinogalactan protein 31-like [Amaranthus tricolor]|uniref:non-classical arabinogalactan protein 31-like n=1 Tax=Amaranthus tricolor TaxID=29722 RepID=UPI002590AE5C|nr:non-classical arabinogalactan protein 31-like [Amaranthus tricolor]
MRGNSIYNNNNGIVALVLLYVLLIIRVDARIDPLKITQPRVTLPFDDDIQHPRQIPPHPSKTPPNQPIIYPPPRVDVQVTPPMSPPTNPPLNALSYSQLTATQTPVNPPSPPPSASYSYPTTSPPPNSNLPIITPMIAPTPSHSPSRAPIMMPLSPISTTPSATINISCRRNMFLKAQRIGITDKDGYFSTSLPQWATSGDCTATLGDAPRKSLCSLKTDLNGGIFGASITKSRRQPGFKIYTVGPFAYKSSGYC